MWVCFRSTPRCFFAEAQDPIGSHNGGGDSFSLWSVFAVTGKPAEVLLEGLPPVIHVRRGPDQSGMRESIDRLMRVFRDRQPGFYLVAQNCSYTLLVQLLRAHLAQVSREGVPSAVRQSFSQTMRRVESTFECKLRTVRSLLCCHK
jgi:hypothetical protein